MAISSTGIDGGGDSTFSQKACCTVIALSKVLFKYIKAHKLPRDTVRILHETAKLNILLILIDLKSVLISFLFHFHRFASSKSGKIYLHTDIRMIIFRKSDLDTATDHNQGKGYELRSFTRGPTNPKFSPRK